MNHSETVTHIISALKSSHSEAAEEEINAETRFDEIPELDSMSIITFQIELGELIGSKAEAAQPILDMKISEYAEVLESL